MKRAIIAFLFGFLCLTPAFADGAYLAPSAIGQAATPLSAALGGTADTGSAWTASSPAATCGTGSPTTITTAMRSKAIGKTTFVEGVVTLTTINTCSGALRIALPSTAQSQAMGSAVNANTSVIEVATIAASGTVISIFTPSAGAFPGINGQEIDFSVVYESQ
jgi:hypothetical protein